VFSGSGINVTTGATDSVVLRGLTINGLGGGNGIYWHAGSDLHVENCTLSNFISDAIANYAASSTTTWLFVAGTTMRQNYYGVITSGPEGLGIANVSVDHCRFEGAGATSVGLTSSGDVDATITRSVAAGLTIGFSVGGGSNMTIDSCIVSHNATGVQADAFGTVHISNSTVTQNAGYGLFQTGTGVLVSAGNNIVIANGTDTGGTITLFAPM
jgi:parallel beta helix pectate lyase-like protein